MEIGSIYEINPQTVISAPPESGQIFSLGEVDKYQRNCKRFTASGREAIALALKSIEANRPAIRKSCLLPAYMCDTVFFPFERAGWEIHFYHIHQDLRADETELCSQINSLQPGLLFIHPYYGIDTWASLRPLLARWRSQGICIMEDVSQSYYLKDAGQHADYIIGSLRKWYPVPDGGFVCSDEPLTGEKLAPNRHFTSGKLNILTQKWNYLHQEGSPADQKHCKEEYLRQNREIENWLDHYDGIGALSPESMNILSSADETLCQNKRNSNYRYLCERLTGQTQFTPIFSGEDILSSLETAPDSGTAPLYFPIYAQNRDRLQKFLTDHHIFAPVLWPIGKANEDCLSAEEHYIYDHMLALPMDQRYGIREMQYLTEVLNQYEALHLKDLPFKEEPELIAIRADANDLVATGHIMRCITIAGQLKAQGKRVLFFTADEYPAAMLTRAGMEHRCLHTAFNRMHEEVPFLRQALMELNCRKLLVDSYQVDQKYFDSLKDLCKIIYIDDCFEAVYPVDMIINYNAYHVRFPYREAYEGKAKLLLGTAYVPLREEFNQSPSHFPQDQTSLPDRHVLLSCGGGDIYHVLGGILSQAMKQEEKEENPQTVFHVVVGSFNQNAEELEQLAGAHPAIRLHYNVTNMAGLMGQCAIAISAAGTMLFELCAMQIPTIFFVCADNQQYDSDFFAEEERMLYAGDIRTDRRECIDRILSYMNTLLNDLPLQRRMKQKLREVTDGSGGRRIAEEIIKL